MHVLMVRAGEITIAIGFAPAMQAMLYNLESDSHSAIYANNILNTVNVMGN